ncbi:uncharacterized protein LOC122381311 [Amphibalanus amphitrite]|uniref:uncharacterized protein LOC122381311 n=1 Tax=Amphibalanus amphitrite TaxID=1232801 RepID=UPI001C908C56|nr:uncharacterized protein LOC122381311 [Amphibalanus amphitrite]
MAVERHADRRTQLRDRLRTFRHVLAVLDEQAGSAGRQLATVDDFEDRIGAVKALQQQLADRRLQLVDINADVHGYVAGGGHSSLKDDVASLYRIWDEVSHRTQSQLEHLSDAAATWREFEAERAALAADMEADRRRLSVLQRTIDGSADGADSEPTGADAAGAAARRPALTSADRGSVAGRSGGGPDELSEGTSGYDSACSDELSERERRLGRLRRMANGLETLLAPAGPAWSGITHSLSEVSTDLRQLQLSCQQLVARTARQLPAQSVAGGWRQRTGPVLRRRGGAAGGPAAPRGRTGRRSWTRRWLRAALPFQVALLLALCAAYLLEPGCCDDLNYLARSLTPQLRYISGPPPI